MRRTAAGQVARLAAAYAFPTAFVLAPLSAFLIYSFWRVENNQLVADFTLANYIEIYQKELYRTVFTGTLLLAAKVMAVSLLLGYPVAYFIWRRQGRLRYLLLLMSVLPLFMSYIIKLYAMRSILGLNGFLNKLLVALGLLDGPSMVFLFNQTAVLITMAVVYLPFAILPIFLSLERVPLALTHASADLGGTAWQTFRYVTLPLSLPGTVIGGLFAFILALGDFVTPQMVGGTTGFTYGKVVWSQFGMGFNWPLGAALGVVLLAAALLIIGLAGFIGRHSRV